MNNKTNLFYHNLRYDSTALEVFSRVHRCSAVVPSVLRICMKDLEDALAQAINAAAATAEKRAAQRRQAQARVAAEAARWAAGRAAGRKLAAFSGAMWAVPAGLFALTKVAPEADFVKLGAAAVVVVNAVRARSPAPLLPGRPSRALAAPQRPWAPPGEPADAGFPPACTPVPRSSSCTSARPGERSPGSGRARLRRRGRRRTSARLRRPHPPPPGAADFCVH